MTAEVQAFIEAEKEADRNVLKACELLVVSRSAFYEILTDYAATSSFCSSTFATVRLRTTVTKGPGGLAMAYKLIESTQTRWRAINAPQLVALVRAGVKFEKGNDGRANYA